MNKLISLLQSKVYFTVCFALFQYSICAQKNLVPNYSFEQFFDCPIVASPPPPPWFEPTNKNGANYFNACSKIDFGIPYKI
jgi:hypothetical protein